MKYVSFNQILISDSSRSRLPWSLPQTQGTSRYCATFLSQISFLPRLVTLNIKCISFISMPHIRFLHINASWVTNPNSGNLRLICKISLTNFIPSASSHITNQPYIILIGSSYQIPPDQGSHGNNFKLKELQRIMQHFSHKFHSFHF